MAKINHKEILKLHNEGFNPFEISHKVSTTIQNVCIVLKKNNLVPNIGVYKLNWLKIDSGLAYCINCCETKPQFDFAKNKKSYTGWSNICKKCQYARILKSNNKTIDHFLLVNFKKIKKRANERNIFFDLIFEEYFNLFKKQNGKCFYTDKDLSWGFGRGRPKDSLSLDRVIPDNGYTVTNVVFCTNKVNYVKSDVTLDEMKDWMPGWYEKIITNDLNLKIN